MRTWRQDNYEYIRHFFEECLTRPFTVRKSGFFLLTPSPWPLFSSFAVFLMLTGFAAYMNYYEGGLFCFGLGVFFVLLSFFF